MVRGRILSLLLALLLALLPVVSYPVPFAAYAADNVKIELRSLSPSYDYSVPKESAPSTNFGNAGAQVKSTDLNKAAKMSASSSGPPATDPNGPDGTNYDLPRIQAPPPPPVAVQIPPSLSRPALTPPASARVLPARVTNCRLVPVGWKGGQDGAGLPDSTHSTDQPSDKDSLYKRLYGWSSTMQIAFSKPVSSKNSKFGDVVEANLVNDFTWGNKVIAPKNSLVRGHITAVCDPKTLVKSALDQDRRFKTRGLLALQFDEIVDPEGHRFMIKGYLCRQTATSSIDSNTSHVMHVDSEGRVIKSEDVLDGKLKTATYTARAATFAPVPGAFIVSTIATPVAMAGVGAISPSVAYNKPIGQGVEHRRTKGAVYGFITNLPGALVVQSFVEKGNEIEIKEGDQVTLSTSLVDSGYRLPPALQANGTVVQVVSGTKPPLQ